jgi:tetratricopeptide (TPR) repeat protein
MSAYPKSPPPANQVLGTLLENARQKHQTGKLAEAEKIYRQILVLDPHHADSLHLLGLLADQKGQHEVAIELMTRAIGISDASFYRNNLGNIMRRLKRYDEAAAHYERAIELKSDNADAHYNFGNMRLEQNRFAEAAECYRRAITLRPDYAAAHMNLGNALRGLDQLADAAECYRQAATIKPDYAEAHYNLANALLDLGKFEEASSFYQRAIALKPDYAEAHMNLGNALRFDGKYDEAIAAYRRAIAVRPDYAEAHTNEAVTHLLTGNFAEGWRQYEWRWHVKYMRAPNLAMPLWDGGDLAGKTILLHCEQGFGDALQFIRYAPLVKARGGKVILSCPQPLARLFTGIADIDRILPEGSPLPACDVQAPLLSLPMLFKTDIDTIPNHIPYLAPLPNTDWAAKIPPGKSLKVGLVWAGNPRLSRPEARAVDKRRSMHLEQMAPLATISGIRFFSLQKGAGVEQIAASGLPVIDLMDQVDDFADTAGLIAQLDLVIGVDTSVIHLAGAMGKPTWVLSRYDGCWRWLLARDDSPWYPGLRLFRQTKPGDWASVIEAVRQALEQKVRSC